MLNVAAGSLAILLLLSANPSWAASFDANAAVASPESTDAASFPARPPAGMRRPAHAGLDGHDGGADTLIFGAPPRGTYETEREIYRPFVEYLSRATGKRIVYRQPGNWLTYQAEMLRGGYDLVFDDPHFISWRLKHQRHHALVRIAEDSAFVVIVRKDDARVTDVGQLAGKKVCAMPPPSLGTLALIDRFGNPSRRPVILETGAWDHIYQDVVHERRCVAGVVPAANLVNYDRNGDFTRIVHRSRTLPNQTLSAGPRVAREVQARIAQALVAPEAAGPTLALRAAHGSEKGFVRAAHREYAGLDAYLEDVWGYGAAR